MENTPELTLVESPVAKKTRTKRTKPEYDYKADCRLLQSKNGMLDNQLRNAIKANQDFAEMVTKKDQEIYKLNSILGTVQRMLGSTNDVILLGGK